MSATAQGLSTQEARRRVAQAGQLRGRPQTGELALLVGQFKSPIILLLAAAAVLSLFLRDATDAAIILGIVAVSGLLGWWQERGAARAVGRLLQMVQVRTRVRREGSEEEVPVEEVAPGDLVLLAAGSTVPADCLLLESQELTVDEAALTGESFPARKTPGRLPADTPLSARANSLFLGTHVVSGTGTALAVQVGRATEFGRIAERLRLRPPETEFTRGVRRFGAFLLELTLLMSFAVLACNLFFRRHLLDSVLFSLSLAVGLTPQLLPTIITVNLSRGAARMARARVIVRRLASIENFGSMDVLCADKTGTLTQGQVRIHSALDVRGRPSEQVLRYACLNAAFESGFANPIDLALRQAGAGDLSAWRKQDELPYDFVRKRLSVLLAREQRLLLVTKGAFHSVLEVCARAQEADGSTRPLAEIGAAAEGVYADASAQGLRVLGVALRELPPEGRPRRELEAEMSFLGFLLLHDPPKADSARTVTELARLGVGLKMVTGDNRLVAASVARAVGLDPRRLLTGPELRAMKDEALVVRAGETQVFAEVEPNQKERIILALRKAGHVVGYLGDGINDASALHAADVGLSVAGAADVAQGAADIVLLKKELSVLVRGVLEGRRTFANTLKYVYMATSANFGNMFSMAAASLFLPFLPLLPKQVLLTNLLTDFPEMTIATDHVEPRLLDRPRRWDHRAIRRFMLVFGPLSSFFDLATFGVLLRLLQASPEQFRTGWFLESVLSACLIVLVVRSRLPLTSSRPGLPLLGATLAVVAAVLALPFTPLAAPLGFVALPWLYYPILSGILAAYMMAAELLKRISR